MHKLMIIVLCAILGTCATCQNTTTTKTEAVEKVAEKAPTPKAKVSAVRKVDPSEITTTQKQSRRNYFTSTARQKEKIDTLFPYDLAFKDLNGKEMMSAEAMPKNGKPTVLLFWLTTCAPCRIEMGQIKKKYAGWKEMADFNLYAISTDFPKNHERFFKTVKEQEWGWDSYLDVNREFLKIMPGNLNGLPQTFILDKNGKIVFHKRKYRHGDEDKLFAKIMEITEKG